MIKTLKIKFVVVTMAFVTVMLAVIFGLVYYFTKTNLEQENIRMLRSAAAVPFRPDRPDKLPEDVRMPFFTLRTSPHGEIEASGNGYFDLSDEEFISELAEIAFSSSEQTGIISEYDLRFCKSHTPMGEAVVFADISNEKAMLENLVRNCIVISVISFVIFFGLSILLAQWAVRPVAKAWEQQRQFVADASHELKTPLTVIITNAEMLRNADFNEEKRTVLSENLLTVSHRMRELVESLLELARADNGSSKTVFTETDLSSLMNEAVLPFEPIYFEKGLELDYSIEDGISVKGDSSQLRRTAEILLDNALKYASPNSKVNFKLEKHGSYCVISASNHGDPISRADLKNIFKRFYRIDKSRSTPHSYGLGLSIAENIVTEHGGKIRAESENGLNTFYIRLPLVNKS
ncbi:MAG: HAMP domain-containing histidine kinase [Oscillospiraceae bacterium]|nr:HAMP domain-containing histidine kinase [Oscillospiraceae bacterium]